MKFGRVTSITVFLFVTAMAAAAQTSAPAPPAFPIARGTYWVYEGDVTYNLTPNQVTTATIRRRMLVSDVVDGKDFRAALIKGGPWDLAFYANNKPAGDYLIVSTTEATYFLQGQQAKEVFAQIKRSGLTHEVRDTLAENVWFRTPLYKDAIFCPPDQLARDDRMYCWAVMDVKSDRIASVPGLKSAPRTVYELAFRTNPDVQTVHIVPGVGIVHYGYSHHGSPSEVDVRLIEYHAGK